MAVSASGQVYVADQGASRIVELSPSGAYLASFVAPTPDGVAVGPAGQVWVSSPGYSFDPAGGSVAGNTVQEFSPSGGALQSFGQTQAGLGALSNPAGIAVMLWPGRSASVNSVTSPSRTSVPCSLFIQW